MANPSINTSVPTLELTDIQGLLIRSYGYLKQACYLMLRFNDLAKGRQWLQHQLSQVTPASVKPEKTAFHIAFTNEGLFTFLPKHQLTEPFSREFTEGMGMPERSRILGDVETNGKSEWQWGSNAREIHAVVMLYALDEPTLQQLYTGIKQELSSYGIQEVIKLDTHPIPEEKEHFGFRDGLSQPLIAGMGGESKSSVEKLSEEERMNTIMPGEFILGYPNEYGKIPFSPKFKGKKEEIDIGKNGSYMVFRQLKQEVKGFWQFMFDTANKNLHFADKDAIYIASKLIGRWPNGNPLTLAPQPCPMMPEDKLNTFLYKQNDKEGFGCPIGAHIRKSNPRDGIDNDPAVSIDIAKRHRILRRGRPFGVPLSDSLEPEAMLNSNGEGERGLYFICFNTNISRQFEFIQQTWDNNAKFDGLYQDLDPIVGFSFLKGEYVPCEFTIQNQPVRQKVKDIPQFVFLRGGAYFFMPGLKALQVMANAD